MAKFMHFSSLKDKNHVMEFICDFGVIENIWEVNYIKFRVFIFKMKVEELDKLGYKGKPFIMTSKENKCFVSMILPTKGAQWFSKEETCMEVMKIKTQILIFLTLLIFVFFIIRERQKNIWSKNVHLHWLQHKMVEEKLTIQRNINKFVYFLNLVACHEMWKKAHIKNLEDYTFDLI
ncbi:hypothetical protein CR513_33142, partial [Mucuna pruriens]